MKRTKLIAFLFNLYSVSAVAGYECKLQLAHTEDLKKVIAEQTVKIGHAHMSSGHVGTLFTEAESRRKRTSIDTAAFLNGWDHEQEAVFVFVRRTETRRNFSSETLSERIAVKGTEKVTGWFDAYKVDIDCKATNERED